MAARDFTYSGSDCTIIYRFSPSTGTLADLRVIYNQNFSFFPFSYGGISRFELGGELLSSREGRHHSQVLEEGEASGVYMAKFRWTYNRESFDFSMKIRLEKKTLIIECSADPSKQNVLEFSLERSEETPDPKVIELPYGHNVLFTNGIFVSGILDPQLSHSSSISPLNKRHSPTSAFFASVATYSQLTDGSRNSLQETVYFSVSPNIEETFYRVRNPVSPYRSFLSNRVIVDLWRDSFNDYRDDLQLLYSLGMKDLFAILHFWQKYGYDNGFPSTYPAGSVYGREEELKEVAQFCLLNGYLLALHTNYVDFYRNSDVWTPSDIALNSEGAWVKAWYNPWTLNQSYLMKPSRALTYAQIYEPLIHDAYSTRASYLDVQTAILPSFKVDYDAKILRAGRQSETFHSYNELLSYVRDLHQGPVAGEGFGYAASIWAGYVDAIEADPRSLFDVLRNRGGTLVPTLVDYKLRVLHGLFVPHGAGHLERFYLNHFSQYTEEELERYRATELVFANAGFIPNPFEKGISHLETLREYCFMKHLGLYYLEAKSLDILYNVRGFLLPLSDALGEVLPAVSYGATNPVLLEELSMLKISYDNGFTIYVNRSLSRTWDIFEGGKNYTLLPGGFLAVKGNEFLAYTALLDGTKRHYLSSGEAACRGNLDDLIYPPLDFAGVKVLNRSLFQVESINVLTWKANPANRNIAKYRIYELEETGRTLLAEVEAQVFKFWHRKVNKAKLYNYALVAVNDEGRDGQAAFLAVQ